MYMKHVHLVLQEDLVDALGEAAIEGQTTRSEVIRIALQEYLRRRARARKAAEMRAYAESMAAHSGEFVEQSEEAVVEQLLRETDW